MRTPIHFICQLLTTLGLGSVAALAFAQTNPGAVITYGPLSATAVPTISGSLLIVLAVLLMLVAVRLLKHRPHAGTNLIIAVMAFAALGSGAGGIRLVADAYGLIAESQMTEASGGTLEIPAGVSQVVNATAVPQRIKSIEYTDGCSNQPPPDNGRMAVSNCSTSTTLAPQSAESCEIEVICPAAVKTCALAWNPNFYVDFSSSNFVGSGNYWSDPDCTVPNGNLSRKWVFSPSGQANATTICIANLGAGYIAIASHGPLVFECVPN